MTSSESNENSPGTPEFENGGEGVDWARLASLLPFRKNAQDKSKREELFAVFDVSSNGYLSLAEIDKAIEDVLGLDMHQFAKPAIMRAYQAVRAATPARAAVSDDYVERHEFRLLLAALYKYCELWHMFDAIDANDDRRIEYGEFELALNRLAAWGVKITNPTAEFAALDADGHGMILFSEFCDWAVRKGLYLEAAQAALAVAAAGAALPDIVSPSADGLRSTKTSRSKPLVARGPRFDGTTTYNFNYSAKQGAKSALVPYSADALRNRIADAPTSSARARFKAEKKKVTNPIADPGVIRTKTYVTTNQLVYKKPRLGGAGCCFLLLFVQSSGPAACLSMFLLHSAVQKIMATSALARSSKS